MKQILQSGRNGNIAVADVPAPGVAPGSVLVKVAASLVSAGTERASLEFASKNLLQKARSRPDLVRDVVNKVRREGIMSAASVVRSRLDQPTALGYSSSGTVVEVSQGITDLLPGDRVACAGANFAVHAEFACVPRMLLARIPSTEVDFESAAFTTLGAVAIHGVRTANAKLGDLVAVIGLGLLGQLTVQILKAAGCRVIGMDLAQDRVDLAAKMGALAVTTSELEFDDLCMRHSRGNGADSVLITAETGSSGPVNLASRVARDRAIVVAVGTVGMDLERKLYYEKELDFRISRSYGPGRYDEAFEQQGRDYPIGYVRWTETRNMEAFLELLADGAIDVRPLITHSFSIEDSNAAYDLVTGKAEERHLGILIRYSPKEVNTPRRLELIQHVPQKSSVASGLSIGLVGAGNFATGTLIPAIKRLPQVRLAGVCSTNGVRARHAADKFGFESCTTAAEEIYSDPSINTVVIGTRHHLHADQIIRALKSRKHVFCEKPLCITEDELRRIEEVFAEADGGLKLMVGFNRRFAPMSRRMKDFVANKGPLSMLYRVNAGPLPAAHWINDPKEGGGRIIGEVCHFVDFLSFMCDASVMSFKTHGVSNADQDVNITLRFSDGSVGIVSYLCNGDRMFSKERVEVYGGGCVAALDDFHRLELVTGGRKKVFRSWLKPDKGHRGEWEAFSQSIESGGPAPIPFEEIVSTTLTTIRAAESLRSSSEQSEGFNRIETVTEPLVS